MSSRGQAPQVTRLSSSILTDQPFESNDLQTALNIEAQKHVRRQRPAATSTLPREKTRLEEVVEAYERNKDRCTICHQYAPTENLERVRNLVHAALEIALPDVDGPKNEHLRRHIAKEHTDVLKQCQIKYNRWVQFIQSRDYALELFDQRKHLYKDNPVRQAELDLQIKKLVAEMATIMQDENMKQIIIRQDKKETGKIIK